MTIQNNNLGAEQVDSLVMEYGPGNMRSLCHDIREEQGNPDSLVGLFREMQSHESWLADGTSACLMAASMHTYLTRQLVVGESLGNGHDDMGTSRLGELRAVLAANVGAETKRGATEPGYSETLERDLIYLRAVAEQPLEVNIGTGASLLLALHAQSRSLP